MATYPPNPYPDRSSLTSVFANMACEVRRLWKRVSTVMADVGLPYELGWGPEVILPMWEIFWYQREARRTCWGLTMYHVGGWKVYDCVFIGHLTTNKGHHPSCITGLVIIRGCCLAPIEGWMSIWVCDMVSPEGLFIIGDCFWIPQKSLKPIIWAQV